MKIVLLSMNFAPELTGIGKYSGEMAKALVERGHEVTVVCAPPYYPQLRVSGDYSNRRWCRDQSTPGMTVIRCPVWVPAKMSGLLRLMHLASFAMSSFPVMLWLVLWRPALVFAVAPALFSVPAAWLTARLCGAKCWLHIQDLEIDAAFELGLLKGRRLRSWATAAERLLMRGFDVVSTISQRMLRQLGEKGVPMDRTELVPNWVDLREVRPTDRSLTLREEFSITADQCVCLFSGTINRKQGLGVLVEAARRLAAHPNIVLVICGFGELRMALEESAGDLRNVRFSDLRPTGELNALLNMADIHLLPQMRSAADLVMPSKLTGMLASGRPIIAAADPGTELAIVVQLCGIVTEPESAEGFANAILELASDHHRRAALGAEARAYAERSLDSTTLLDRLNSRMLALCASPSVPPIRPLANPRMAALQDVEVHGPVRVDSAFKEPVPGLTRSQVAQLPRFEKTATPVSAENSQPARHAPVVTNVVMLRRFSGMPLTGRIANVVVHSQTNHGAVLRESEVVRSHSASQGKAEAVADLPDYLDRVISSAA